MGDRELGVLQRKSNVPSQQGEKDEKNKYLINNNEKK